MQNIICIISDDFFTAGRTYAVLDNGPALLVTDNFNSYHYISPEYFEAHFETV